MGALVDRIHRTKCGGLTCASFGLGDMDCIDCNHSFPEHGGGPQKGRLLLQADTQNKKREITRRKLYCDKTMLPGTTALHRAGTVHISRCLCGAGDTCIHTGAVSSCLCL